MKICNSDTRYLAFLVCEEEIPNVVLSNLTVQAGLTNDNNKKGVIIRWRFCYLNDMAKEVLGEQVETRFNYSITEDIERDYEDCKKIIFQCYWDLQSHLRNKYEIGFLCDFNLENVTCQIMEMIIMRE